MHVSMICSFFLLGSILWCDWPVVGLTITSWDKFPVLTITDKTAVSICLRVFV